MIDTLAARVKMLRAEVGAAWKRLLAHEAKHGCQAWVYDWRSGHLEHHPERRCAVGALLCSVWVEIKNAAELPSQDERLYRDAEPEWTAPTTTAAVAAQETT